MQKYAMKVFQNLSDPLVVVPLAGTTLESNRAFRALAERVGVAPDLAQLFGAEIHAEFERAWGRSGYMTHLRLAAGPEPRPLMRLTFTTDAVPQALVVLVIEANLPPDGARAEQVADAAGNGGTAPAEPAALEPAAPDDGPAFGIGDSTAAEALTVLKEIGAALSSAFELDELAEHICVQTVRIIATQNLYVALHNRDPETVSFLRYIEDGAWKEMQSRPFGNGLTEYVLRTGMPLVLNRDVAEHAAALGVVPVGRPCACWIGVPLVADGQTLGVLALQDYDRPDRYQPRDLELLSVIASQAAAAVRTTRLLSAARAAYQELSETQARLLETERLRGVTETVGAMNHEINNPLAAIAGNAQLLIRRGAELGPGTLLKIESILEAARRIQRVTAKMATLIQATSMPYPGETTIIDVHRSLGRDASAPGESPALPSAAFAPPGSAGA